MLKTLILITALIWVSVEAQDEIYFANGGIAKGSVDRNVLTSTAKSIRFKPTGFDAYQFYNIDQINLVKGWNGRLLYPVGVIVNTETGIFHLPKVKHLPAEGSQSSLGTGEEAILKGFSACEACFDPHPSIANYSLEQQLVQSTILQIQNTNEILYEHIELPKLQKMIETILATWPEKLKGYKYRIQIIRDDAPNAMAVAGGNLYVTSGLLGMIEYDQELNSVLAHEIAHVERRHMLRQYKERQEKEQAMVIFSTFLMLGAIATESEGAMALGSLMTAVASFATEFAIKGYSRDLEQESDMMAQIWVDQNKGDISSMVSVMDKLATHTITRNGFIPGTHAYSSHPDIRARIAQIENSTFHKFDDPLVLQFFSSDKTMDFEHGFVEMEVQYAYMANSSTKGGERETILIGSVLNHHPDFSFQLNEVSLNILGSLGQVTLQGIADVVVPFSGETEFVGRIKYPSEAAIATESSITKKKMLPVSVNLSAIVLNPGEEPGKFWGLQDINCRMTIK